MLFTTKPCSLTPGVVDDVVTLSDQFWRNASMKTIFMQGVCRKWGYVASTLAKGIGFEGPTLLYFTN